MSALVLSRMGGIPPFSVSAKVVPADRAPDGDPPEGMAWRSEVVLSDHRAPG